MNYYEAIWDRENFLQKIAYEKWQANNNKSSLENWIESEQELLNTKPSIILYFKKYMYVEKNISFKDINEKKEFVYNGAKYYISDRKLTGNYLIALNN